MVHVHPTARKMSSTGTVTRGPAVDQRLSPVRIATITYHFDQPIRASFLRAITIPLGSPIAAFSFAASDNLRRGNSHRSRLGAWVRSPLSREDRGTLSCRTTL